MLLTIAGAHAKLPFPDSGSENLPDHVATPRDLVQSRRDLFLLPPSRLTPGQSYSGFDG